MHAAILVSVRGDRSGQLTLNPCVAVLTSQHRQQICFCHRIYLRNPAIDSTASAGIGTRVSVEHVRVDACVSYLQCKALQEPA
jgi:hypothetical protein